MMNQVLHTYRYLIGNAPTYCIGFMGSNPAGYRQPVFRDPLIHTCPAHHSLLRSIENH